MIHCSWALYNTGGCWPHGQPTVAYNELSGFLSIILPPLFTLAGIALLWWWHHQCSVHSCYWYARRTTAAGEHACFRHHPAPKRSAEGLRAAHHAVVASRNPFPPTSERRV